MVQQGPKQVPIPVLTFPATPSQNTYQRAHWAQQARLLDETRWLIRSQLRAAGVWFVDLPERRVTVTIRRYSPGRLDRGNFIGGCKALLDALRHEGVIVDDSEAWLDDHYEQHECKRGESRTEVEIR
jgi:hypothetical protein